MTMKVQTDKLAKILGEEFMEELVVERGVEHPIYGEILLVDGLEADGTISVRCTDRLFDLSVGYGSGPAVKLGCVGEGEYGGWMYLVDPGMVYVGTNGDGDIWTKDGDELSKSDLRFIARFYNKQLPLDRATDKGLYVW